MQTSGSRPTASQAATIFTDSGVSGRRIGNANSTAPYMGYYRPAGGDLNSVFAGKQLNGTWTLRDHQQRHNGRQPGAMGAQFQFGDDAERKLRGRLDLRTRSVDGTLPAGRCGDRPEGSVRASRSLRTTRSGRTARIRAGSMSRTPIGSTTLSTPPTTPISS